MYATRNLPSTRCSRVVLGVEHSLLQAASISRCRDFSAARVGLGSWELLSAAPAVAAPGGHGGQGRLPSDSGRGPGALLSRELRAGRWFPAAPRRAGACTSRPGLAFSRPPGRAHGQSRRRAGRSRRADMELRVALGLALLCSALEAAPAGPQRARSALGESAGGQPSLRGPAWRAGERGEGRPGEQWGPAGMGGGLRGPACGSFPSPGAASRTQSAAVAFPVPAGLGHTGLLGQSTRLFSGTGGHIGFIFSCPGRPGG